MSRYLPDGRKAYNPNRTEADIHQEWRDFETMLRAWGADDIAVHMQSRELWRREEADGERWSEWQQRVWYPRQRALAAQRPSYELTVDEWRYLADTFTDANHPLAQSIQRKASHQR